MILEIDKINNVFFSIIFVNSLCSKTEIEFKTRFEVIRETWIPRESIPQYTRMKSHIGSRSRNPYFSYFWDYALGDR